MRRLALIAIALLGVVSAPAAAAGTPATTHRQLNALVDRFVKDVVLRRNLSDGWTLAGPYLRGGTTHRAWLNGSGVTVMAFPAIGNDFRHAWTGTLLSPTRAELTVTLRSRGKNAEILSAQTVVIKRGSRWLVDTFYPAGIIRLGKGHSGSCGTAKCAISGTNDFGPQAGGGGGGSLGVPSQHAAATLWIVLGSIAGFVVLSLVGLLVRVRWRDRRARLAYEASRLRSS